MIARPARCPLRLRTGSAIDPAGRLSSNSIAFARDLEQRHVPLAVTDNVSETDQFTLGTLAARHLALQVSLRSNSRFVPLSLAGNSNGYNRRNPGAYCGEEMSVERFRNLAAMSRC